MVRYKNRYLLLELRFSSAEEGHRALKAVNPKSLLAVLREAILLLHGDYGLACVQHSLNVKYMNVLTRVFVLRCPRDHHKAVWSAVSTITTLNKVPCAINLLHLGGTIRSCQRFLINHNQKQLREMIRSTQNPVERKELEQKVKAVLDKDSIPLRV